MALVKRKVVNPAPSVLALVNETRGRRNMPRRRGRRYRTNPRRRGLHGQYARLRKTARRHGSHASLITRMNRKYLMSGMRRHRLHRRRHNPLGVSGGEIANFAVGGIGLAMAQPVVNRLIGGLLPLGQFNAPVITAGTGWLLSKLFEAFHFTKRFAQPTLILGFSTAVIQVVQPYVSNLIGGGAAMPAPAPGMSGWPQGYSGWNAQRIGAMRHRRGRPMRGIGVTTGIPPTIVPPPLPPAPTSASPTQGAMQGLGMRPGVWAH